MVRCRCCVCSAYWRSPDRFIWRSSFGIDRPFVIENTNAKRRAANVRLIPERRYGELLKQLETQQGKRTDLLPAPSLRSNGDMLLVPG